MLAPLPEFCRCCSLRMCQPTWETSARKVLSDDRPLKKGLGLLFRCTSLLFIAFTYTFTLLTSTERARLGYAQLVKISVHSLLVSSHHICLSERELEEKRTKNSQETHPVSIFFGPGKVCRNTLSTRRLGVQKNIASEGARQPSLFIAFPSLTLDI